MARKTSFHGADLQKACYVLVSGRGRDLAKAMLEGGNFYAGVLNASQQEGGSAMPCPYEEITPAYMLKAI